MFLVGCSSFNACVFILGTFLFQSTSFLCVVTENARGFFTKVNVDLDPNTHKVQKNTAFNKTTQNMCTFST